jgi:hypothetical protein
MFILKFTTPNLMNLDKHCVDIKNKNKKGH